MSKWSGKFDVRSRDSFANICLILGFIAIIFFGVPIYFLDKGISVGVIIFGSILIIIGIYDRFK